MSAPIPLPVFPWPMSDERVALLQQAKARIDTPIRVLPVQAAWDSPGRVLSFGRLPPFMCRSLPIAPQNVGNVDSIEQALRAFLDPWFPEEQYAEEFWLGTVMGCEVRYSHTEDETGKVIF